MKIHVPELKKDKRGGNHQKVRYKEEPVNLAKDALDYLEYIELVHKTIVNDVVNEYHYYKSFSQLIHGMRNNIETNPLKRLPSEKTQRDYIREYLLGSKSNNKKKFKYSELVKKCLKDYSKEQLELLMRNGDFIYDFTFYDANESPSDYCHPNIVFFSPEGKEDELAKHFKVFFAENIKALMIGYKCLMIFFEDYKNLEFFIKKIEELLGERDYYLNGKKKRKKKVKKEGQEKMTSELKQSGQDEGVKKADEIC